MKKLSPIAIALMFLVFGVATSYLLPATLNMFVRALAVGVAAGLGVWIAVLILNRSKRQP